jgi:hypothetical protein
MIAGYGRHETEGMSHFSVVAPSFWVSLLDIAGNTGDFISADPFIQIENGQVLVF